MPGAYRDRYFPYGNITQEWDVTVTEWTAQWSPMKWLADGVSITAVVGALVGVLPVLAALVGIIYYVIQIAESRTVRRWKEMRRARRILRRMGPCAACPQLKAAQKVLMDNLSGTDHPDDPERSDGNDL